MWRDYQKWTANYEGFLNDLERSHGAPDELIRSSISTKVSNMLSEYFKIPMIQAH